MTFNNIKDFVQGYYNYFRNYLDDESLPKHVREQALYRAMQCVGCLNNGKCTECGCATPAMFFSPGKEDSLGRWGKMIDSAEWEIFKSENNIELINNFEDIMFEEIRKKYNFAVLKPEWFVYRGQNVFDKMNPAFLMTLDEVFDRVGVVPQMAQSWAPDKGVFELGKAIALNVLGGSKSVIWNIVKEAMNLGLSVDVTYSEYITFSMIEVPEFKTSYNTL